MAAAMVISRAGHENTTDTLCGSLLGVEKLVSTVSQVIGRDIEVQQGGEGPNTHAMQKAGLRVDILRPLVGIQRSIREGISAIKSRDYETLLGRSLPLDQARRGGFDGDVQSNVREHR